jgi:hypothetical protein
MIVLSVKMRGRMEMQTIFWSSECKLKQFFWRIKLWSSKSPVVLFLKIYSKQLISDVTLDLYNIHHRLIYNRLLKGNLNNVHSRMLFYIHRKLSFGMVNCVRNVQNVRKVRYTKKNETPQKNYSCKEYSERRCFFFFLQKYIC